MIRVAAFDFDGVLVDSVSLKDQALESLFLDQGPETAGRALQSWLRHKGMFRPHRLRVICREVWGRTPEEGELAALLRRFEAHAVERTIAAPWIAGARETLEGLRRRSIPRYVVSAGPQEEVETIIRRRGMAEDFTRVFGFGETTHKRDVLLDIARSEGIEPGEMLFVGDSITDGEAARQAGTAFVGIVPSGSVNPFPGDLPIRPDLTGLLAWIDAQG
ncbi:MAG: HAD family hydrolase [Magnetococcales bacterium]|nr:HAD family hydrolase [Magnetococcales bacterium]